MTDLALFDNEAPVEKLTRRQRIQALNSGPHSAVDGLTDGERALLASIRSMGLEIVQTWMINRNGQRWQAERRIRKAV